MPAGDSPTRIDNTMANSLFQPIENMNILLLRDIFVKTASANPNYPFMIVVDGEDLTSAFRIKTHSDLIRDASKAAAIYQKDITQRVLGTTPRNVGILARNSYDYAVQWLACQFNNWSVSRYSRH